MESPWAVASRLTLIQVKGCYGGSLLTGNADGSKLFLVAHDVLLKGSQQTLGMLWSQNHPTPYLRLRYSRQHPRKVYDKITALMRDDGKISILTLSHILWQFQLQTLLLFVVVVHTHYIFILLFF